MNRRFRLLNQVRFDDNPGGWYKDNQAGDVKYVKLYKNPEQALVEAFSNTIYHHLNIPAVSSELIEVDGRLALANTPISGYCNIPDSTLQLRQEIMENFATDALLANYDVFGQHGDNVIQTPSGLVYRIDNGGTLHFRARGKNKPFPSNTITEIDSMRDPNIIPFSSPDIAQSTAGRVYYSLSHEDIARSAEKLHKNLTPNDIRAILNSFEFTENTQDMITKSLLGRLAYLKQRFNF